MDDLFAPTIVESPRRDYEVVVYDDQGRSFETTSVRTYDELTALCRRLARLKKAYRLVVWQFGHRVARCELARIRKYV